MRPGCFPEEMLEARLHSVSKTCGRRRTAVRFGASTSSLPRLLRLPREIDAFYAYRAVLLSSLCYQLLASCQPAMASGDLVLTWTARAWLAHATQGAFYAYRAGAMRGRSLRCSATLGS